MVQPSIPVVAGGGTDAGAPSVFWTMNESSIGAIPVTREDSIGALDLTDNTSGVLYTTSTTGQINNAAAFAGDNDLRRVHNTLHNFHPSTGGTLSFWIKTNGPAGNPLSKYDYDDDVTETGQWRLSVGSAGWTLNLAFSDGVFTPYNFTDPLPNGNWHHVVFTVNPATDEASLYIDGTFERTVTIDAGNLFDDTSAGLLVGIDYTGASPVYFNGAIDAVGQWKGTVFTQDNVTYEYNSGTGRER